ncbi:MAG: UDP-N-acetylmuramate--L-alanine ligase [Oscillospiraceae bacterium]
MIKINKDILKNVKHIHFVGIGGSGMYPIVQILNGQGFTITGSDTKTGNNIDDEIKMGIKVFMEHNPNNIDGSDIIVYTAAVHSDNPELIEAKKRGIPTIERSEMLGLITSWYKNCICVSGTHGKTTTSGMITQILLDTKADPTAVIGSKLPAIGGNGRLGKSENMVCESCEFKDTFLHLYPDISIILNIDEDHLDYFKNLENIIKSFHTFAEMTTKIIIVNGDDENSLAAVKNLDKEIITFGIDSKNEFYAKNVVSNGLQSSYDLMHNNEKLAHISLNVAGIHNVYNSISACIAAILSGVDISKIPDAIANFKGTSRRFEFLGNVDGVTIVDDFAHHPTEITASLSTAKKLGFNKIWTVFQPYTYSRTALLLDDFAKALSISDKVVMTEIVSAREENTFNIYTKDLAEKIEGSLWFNSFEEITDYVMKNAQKGDLVLTMGGGDIYKCARMMLQYKK